MTGALREPSIPIAFSPRSLAIEVKKKRSRASATTAAEAVAKRMDPRKVDESCMASVAASPERAPVKDRVDA
jgi:hypothetical protein